MSYTVKPGHKGEHVVHDEAGEPVACFYSEHEVKLFLATRNSLSTDQLNAIWLQTYHVALRSGLDVLAEYDMNGNKKATHIEDAMRAADTAVRAILMGRTGVLTKEVAAEFDIPIPLP